LLIFLLHELGDISRFSKTPFFILCAMENAPKKYSKLQIMLGAENVGSFIVHHPRFGEFLGSQDAALILEFLLGWDGKQWNSDGWIHKSAIELEAETGLSKYQQGRAIKILLTLGLIEKKLMRVPAKNHFRVKKPILQERWVKWIQANPAPVKKRRTVSEEPQRQLVSNQPTTTYITHDDTHSPTASVKNSSQTGSGNDFESIGRIRMRMARDEALGKIREENSTNNLTPSIPSGDNPTISGTS
jgi:hypothetical protein